MKPTKAGRINVSVSVHFSYTLETARSHRARGQSGEIHCQNRQKAQDEVLTGQNDLEDLQGNWRAHSRDRPPKTRQAQA